MTSATPNPCATAEPAAQAPARRKVRLAYLVSHPIQYQAPLLRRIALEAEIDLTVLYGSDFSIKGYKDEGFGVDIQWDVPLLSGYTYEFLPALRDAGHHSQWSPISRGLLKRLHKGNGGAPFDVLWVHGYAMVNELYGILAAKALGIKVLVRSDSSLSDRPRAAWKLLLKRFFFAGLRQVVDGVLASGTRNLDYWRFYMGHDFPIFLLPYAVDNTWFQQQVAAADAKRAELQRELGLEPGRPVILFASKLQKRKHCADLIAAYAALAPESIEPRPYLVIVGDGEERSTLERQARETGLTGIRFCGFRNQSEMPRFFDLCAVFVLPAQHEPWGLIVNEVMNAARPVIVSDDVGCVPDLITDGVEGYVYPVHDIEALANALRRVLASPEDAVAMGRKALQRIEGWSFDADVRELGQALHQVLGTTEMPGQPSRSK